MRAPRKDTGKDRGAVLLTTLLIMGLMAITAVAIMDDIRFAVKRAANVQSYAQADWYAKGAEDFAASYLTERLGKASPQQLNLILRENQPISLPIDGGTIALSVRDGSQCLSLGALGPSSINRTFEQMLTTLGWSKIDAARLTAIAVDWQDDDSEVLPGGAEDYTYLGRAPAYRTANTTFGSVTEMRALNLLSEEQYQSLRPYICARSAGQTVRVNVNTLSVQQAPLLAAILGGPDGFTAAAQLLDQRPEGGYTDLTALRAAPALENYDIKNAQLDQLSFEPQYIWIEAQITYQAAQRTMAFEFAIEDKQLKRLYRGFGEEALRPILKDPEL